MRVMVPRGLRVLRRGARRPHRLLQTFGESPGCDGMAMPRDAVIHASLSADAVRLMGSDCPKEHFRPMQGLYVALQIDDPDRARRVFEALMDGGRVQMPFAPTFWSAGFGCGTDLFGTPLDGQLHAGAVSRCRSCSCC